MALLVLAAVCAAACSRRAPSHGGVVRFHGVDVRSHDGALTDVDAIGYEIDLKLVDDTPGQETFTTRTTGTYVAMRPLTSVTLDLEGNRVDAVAVDGQTAVFTRRGMTLEVALPRSMSAGRAFTVAVSISGALFQASRDAEPGGLMVHQANSNGRRIFNSFNWPSTARRWLALRDHPRDGALVVMHATFPRALTVLANGAREAVVDNADGTRTWTWFERNPMATYDIHVAAYDDWVELKGGGAQGVETRAWLYRSDAPGAERAFATAPLALQYFSETFGPYRWEKADFVEVPISVQGMEYASLIAMNEQAPTVGVGHELAHHWSGNLVRIASWNDLWLSEGMADYLDNRFAAAREGADAERTAWRSERAGAFAAEALEKHALRPPDPEVDMQRILDQVSYAKGAWVLRMLERRMGEGAFTRFLRAWFDEHAFAAAGTSDFERALVTAWGPEATRFFADWVYGLGHPECTVSLQLTDGGVDVIVEQTQRTGPEGGFRFPLDVELVGGNARQRLTVDVTGRHATAHARVPFVPKEAFLDPDVTLYAHTDCRAAIPCQ